MNFRITFFTFIFLFTVQVKLKAQNVVDTIYYDNNWKETIKENMQYYRLTILTNEGYQVKDYYQNNNIQMTGFCKSLKPEIKNGYFKFYFENGKVSSEGNYSNNKRNGVYKYYSSKNGSLTTEYTYVDEILNGISRNYSNEGDLESECNYVNNNLDGIYKYYYPNKNVWYEGNYIAGKKDGKWFSYYQDGKIKRTEKYKKDKLKKGKCYTKLGKDTTYYAFFQLAEFPGGYNQFIEYLRKTLIYPEEAKAKGIVGKVHIAFIIKEDGSIDGVNVKKRVDPLLDLEALHIITNMPNWICGRKDGVPVSTSFEIPIKFSLK